MTLYHMSDSLQLGDTLNGDFQHLNQLIEPFFRALMRSEDCFYAMLMNVIYTTNVFYRNNIHDRVDHPKYATEAIFEYVRCTQFPDCNSRIWSNYFYDDLEQCRRFYDFTWGKASEEFQRCVHMYEIEVDQATLDKRDMRIYDIAYKNMCEETDIAVIKACARRYFAGEATDDPVWEYLSEAEAIAVRDVTEYLRKN